MLPNFKIILADVHFAKLYCVCACVSAYVFVMTNSQYKPVGNFPSNVKFLRNTV